jgi:hypothetical protein
MNFERRRRKCSHFPEETEENYDHLDITVDLAPKSNLGSSEKKRECSPFHRDARENHFSLLSKNEIRLIKSPVCLSVLSYYVIECN